MHRRLDHWLIVVLVVLAATAVVRANVLVDADVFVGTNADPASPDPSPQYRIPSIIQTTDGSLLAFIQARIGTHDPGVAVGGQELHMKRSTDNGVTWSPVNILMPKEVGGQLWDWNGWNPVNLANGDLGFFYTKVGDYFPNRADRTNEQFWMTSSDGGQTFSTPAELTGQIKDPTWGFLDAGPGRAIRLQWQTDPARNDRIVLTGKRTLIPDNNFVGLSIYSDDGGVTWDTGALTSGPNGAANENEVVELTNGDLLMDARNGSSGHRERWLSSNGGESWTHVDQSDFFITAVDGSLIRYSARRSGHDRDRLLFSGPLGTDTDPNTSSGKSRNNIAVWTSYDEGQTFINPVQIKDGHGGYSALEALNDGTIGLFYEATSTTRMRFVRFDLAHLEGVAHHATMTHFDGFYNPIDSFRGGVGWSGSWQPSGQVGATPGGLEFNRFQLFGDTTHVRLQAGGEMSRSLGTAVIDMNLNQTYFVSLFVRKESEAADQKWLSIRLDENGARQYAFGVHSDTFFIGLDQASTNQFSTEMVDLATSYYLLAKIEAQDDSLPTNFDQISMAWYDDPLQVPSDEAQVNWQLVGPSGINGDGLIDSLFIRTGSQGDWSVDALRVATSFDGAVYADGPSTLLGDLDDDGNLDSVDVDLFVAAWLMDTSALSDEMKMGAGDLNIDGVINLADAFLMHNAFAQQGISLPLGAFTIPEPGTFLIMAISVLLIKVRRVNARRCNV